MQLRFTHSVLQNECYVIMNNVTSVFMKSRSFAAEWRVTAMLLYSDCQLLLIAMLLYSDLSTAPHCHVTVLCIFHHSFLFLKHVSIFKCLEYYCFGMDFRKCCTSFGYNHIHKILHHYQILIMYYQSICGVFVVTCTIICVISFSYTNLVIIICCDWKEKLVFVLFCCLV